MNRLRIGVSLFMALTLATVLAAPRVAFSQTKITLSYATFAPTGTFPAVQMDRWAKEVERRTNNKVKVNTFPGGSLLPAKNIFDGVINGVADIGHLSMTYQPGRFPVSEAIDQPLGFTNTTAASLALFDLMQQYQKEFEKVKVITFFTCPPTNLLTRRPIKSLKDLKGVELRTFGTAAEALRRLGAIPVSMPQSDTPEAIQKGVVKGLLSSVDVLKDFGFAAYCPFVTEIDLMVGGHAVVMNQAKWNSLPDDVKKVIDGLRREQAEWTGRYLDQHVKDSVMWSKQKYNLQVIQLPAEEKAEIPKLMKTIVEDYVKRVTAAGYPGEQIMQEVYRLKDKYEKEYKN